MCVAATSGAASVVLTDYDAGVLERASIGTLNKKATRRGKLEFGENARAALGDGGGLSCAGASSGTSTSCAKPTAAS